jgi:hypothetical protein
MNKNLPEIGTESKIQDPQTSIDREAAQANSNRGSDYATRDEVVWLYRAILGRDPESEDVIAEACQLRFQDLRARLFRSEEFAELIFGKKTQDGRYRYGGEGDLDPSVFLHAPLSARGIQSCYRLMLERDVESSTVIDSYLAERINFFDLVSRIKKSSEMQQSVRKIIALNSIQNPPTTTATKATRSTRPHKVLAIGAYGNANLGDIEQPTSIRNVLNALIPEPGLESIDFTSWEQISTCQHSDIVIRSPSALFEASTLCEYTAILFAGGGLFGAPHFPLFSDRWVQWFLRLGIPYGLFAVGASSSELQTEGHCKAYGSLLKGAAFLSGRDSASITALGEFSSRVELIRDPILLDPEFDKAAPVEKDDAIVIYVPKFPVDIVEEKAIEWMVREQRACLAEGQQVVTVLFEPPLDKQIAHRFVNVKYVHSLGEVLGEFSKASTIISMRYHGVILGIKCKTRTYGLGAQKIRDLLNELELTEFFLEPHQRPQVYALNNLPVDMAIIDSALARARADFLKSSGELLKLMQAKQ